MGQWPIRTQRCVTVRANTPDKKKPLSGAFTRRCFDEALARDYTAMSTGGATPKTAYFVGHPGC
jgi:hypothetical protein